ncbi:MAG: amidohydrolase family protein [Candidatus Tritonobacter lacicola]|nr:amidohydrolase family protein [Candidatus Tritonobacter lacicola]
MWNDYVIPPDLDQYSGIKWHRHPDEPKYDYSDPRCSDFLGAVREYQLPVLLEEEYENTARFIERNPDLNIIIPHMGERNGGTFKMKAFFDHPLVYFDTSTASQFEIGWLLEIIGPRRIIFGSDVSGTAAPFFNFPWIELLKIEGLKLSRKEKEMIYSRNILRILKPSGRRRKRKILQAVDKGASS